MSFMDEIDEDLERKTRHLATFLCLSIVPAVQDEYMEAVVGPEPDFRNPKCRVDGKFAT